MFFVKRELLCQTVLVYFNSGLHVFQFSSDYSPLHEELTEKKKTKRKQKSAQ